MHSMTMTASRFYQPSTPNQSAAYEDIKSYTKILKYFFIEAGVGDFRKEELFSKFHLVLFYLIIFCRKT